MEQWKDIIGYNGRYQVSNMGNVKSIEVIKIDKRGRERIKPGKELKLTLCATGYNMVTLSYGEYGYSKLKTYSVHRLVAKSFTDNPNDKPCINHIDGNKNNNYINNLEWATYKENAQHALKTGLRYSTNINIEEFRELYNNSNLQVIDVAKKYNISTVTLYRICKRNDIKLRYNIKEK